MKLVLLLWCFHCTASFLFLPNRALSSRSFGCVRASIPSLTKPSTCLRESIDGDQCDNIFSRAYRKYVKLSERRPYPTKAISASIIVGIGAVLSQWIQATSGGIPLVLDWHQIRSFALTGLLFEGPYLHWWYEQLFKLGRYLVDSAGLSSRAMTVAQIAVDETIGVMIFFPAYFFAFELTQSMLLLRGKNYSSVTGPTEKRRI